MARGQSSASPPSKSPEPTAEEFAAAAAYEEDIAAEATAIRSDAEELTPALFMKLYPLLRKPIPGAYIQKIGATTGKPYESTGIRSVQVQIDRMNNVLTPLWWWDAVDYEDGGKLAKVTVCVGNPSTRYEGEPLVLRSSRGGVGQGSGAGNIYKGSYTNAAKLAFARLGPGHEVYLGAADLDPDVNEAIAQQAPSNGAAQGQPADNADVGPGIASKLVDRAWEIPTAKSSLQLAASHAAGRDVGDCSTKKAATEGLAGLNFAQAEKLDRWLQKKETEAEVDDGQEKGGSDA